MKRNKKLSIILAVALVLSLFGGMVVRERTSKAAVLNRDNDEYYLVNNWEDLKTMATMIESDDTDYSGAEFKLTADISAPANNKWEPIGYKGAAVAPKTFSGEFDGDGHTISGLNIILDRYNSNNIGFFNTVEGGIIMDVTFENCSIVWDSTSGDEIVRATNLGIVAGTITSGENGDSELSNVTVTNCNIVPNLPYNDTAKSTVANAYMVAGQIAETTEIDDVILSNNNAVFPTTMDTYNVGTTSDTTPDITDQGGTYSGGGSGGGGTGPTNPTPTPTPGPTEEPDPVTPPTKGDAFVFNKVNYEVTGEKTIIVKKPDTNSSTVKIPQYIVKNGVKFKVVGIDKKAFYKNKKLKTIYIPDSIKSIGNSAFAYCDLLKYVYIQKMGTQQVTEQSMDALVPVSAAINISIGANAFLKCVALKKVVINCQVTSIGNSAFSLCKKLSSIVVYSKKLRTVGKKALNGVHNCKISVPKVKVKPYKSLFKNKGQGKKVVVAKM